jgi:hypothetical protein
MDTIKQQTSPWIPLDCVSGRAEKNDSFFAVLDKVKPDIENIRGLNLAVVKPTTVQVSKMPL